MAASIDTDSRMREFRAKRDRTALRMAMVGNFSAAYNLVVVNLALPLLEESRQELSRKSETSIAVACLVGSILGQLSFGRVGDVFGLERGMFLSAAFIILGAGGSALVFGDNPARALTLMRLILGIGVGGVYPLAAGMAQKAGGKKDMGQAGAIAFSFSGLGMTATPVVFLILLSIKGLSHDAVWRIALAFGALPCLGVLYLLRRLLALDLILGPAQSSGASSVELGTVRMVDAVVGTKRRMPLALPSRVPASVVRRGLREHLAAPGTRKRLVGTCLSWFLFDVTFYGNALFAPIVLRLVFGAAEEPFHMAYQMLIINILALPGFLLSALLMDRLGPRYIQCQGFAACALIYTGIGALMPWLSGSPQALLVLYGASFLFSNFGANATTYILPAYTFPPEVRATLNGISAASGKAGAVVGGALFIPILSHGGVEAVMFVCAGISVAGLLTTMTTVMTPAERARQVAQENEGKDEVAQDYNELEEETEGADADNT